MDKNSNQKRTLEEDEDDSDPGVAPFVQMDSYGEHRRAVSSVAIRFGRWNGQIVGCIG